MSQLVDLQQTFLHDLFKTPNSILSEIKSHPALTASKQYSLYQDSITARLQKALRNIYPVCCKLVGDNFFAQMSREFIFTHPSTFKDLNEYGSNFGNFITGYSLAASLPYLADTAKLEWAWHILFAAPATNDFNFAKLAACYETDPDNIVFLLPECSTLISSPYPIHHIWHVNQTTFSGCDEITLIPNEQYYVWIWHAKNEMHIDAISNMDFEMLNWFKQKKTIHELCCKISASYPDIIISELINEWITKGYLQI